jgi:DNA-directed RNA polymerase subunit RPC12/RpoP
MSELTIELVTMPVVCMECGRAYKRIVAPPMILEYPDAVSSGYCPKCAPRLLDKVQGLYGEKRGGATA